MPVFTLFCHGTNENRSNGHSDEIIHALSDKVAGTEYEDFLILDGPGSGGASAPMAGSFDAFDQHKGAKGSAPQWSRTSNGIVDMSTWEGGRAAVYNPSDVASVGRNIGNLFSGGKAGKVAGLLGVALSPVVVPIGAAVLKGNSKVRGLIYGEGMDDNIRHAIAAIANKWPSMSGVTINMVGWSRGAITCIRTANWIQEFLGREAEINIFAVDPVAGGDLGEVSADTYTIPECVKNFVAVLVMDDRRGGFRPQDIRRLTFASDATKYALLPVPGAHDTPVKLKNPLYPEIGLTTRYLAYKFLKLHGTVFKTAEAMIPAMLLAEEYAQAKLKLKGYKKLGKKGVGKAVMGGIITRDIASEVDLYVSHSTEFFLNEHHVEAFKMAFPKVYALFFTAAPGIPRAGATSYSAPASSDLGRALQLMYQNSPGSFELLSNLGMVERRTSGGGLFSKAQVAFWTVKPCGLAQADNGACPNGRLLLRTLIG